MSLVKILVITFFLFAESRSILRLRDNGISRLGFFFWSLVWISILIVVFKPGIANQISTIFGIQRGTDGMFFLSIILLLYLIFRLYVRICLLDNHITMLTTGISKELHKRDNGTDTL